MMAFQASETGSRPHDFGSRKGESVRSKNDVFIALGSNIAPETHLIEAVRRLGHDLEIVQVSSVWESAPLGDPDVPGRNVNQANFCNAAIRVHTDLDVSSLKFDCLRRIEAELGRMRDPHNRYASRTIDLDVAFYNRDLFQLPGCDIPDPEIVSRPFLAVPLAELAPEFVHPVVGRTLREISQQLGGTQTLRLRTDIILPTSGLSGCTAAEQDRG